MRAFGAHLEVIPSPDGITLDLIPAMQRRARGIVTETGGYPTDQFHNPHMVAGYRTLGVEITQQVPAPVDVYCG
jgi:cysteine synthase A